MSHMLRRQPTRAAEGEGICAVRARRACFIFAGNSVIRKSIPERDSTRLHSLFWFT